MPSMLQGHLLLPESQLGLEQIFRGVCPHVDFAAWCFLLIVKMCLRFAHDLISALLLQRALAVHLEASYNQISVLLVFQLYLVRPPVLIGTAIALHLLPPIYHGKGLTSLHPPMLHVHVALPVLNLEFGLYLVDLALPPRVYEFLSSLVDWQALAADCAL